VLILVRHGESTANALGLLLGRTDAPLTEVGRAQAVAARRQLPDTVGRVISSPLQRARDTASLLDLGCPIEIDDRWIEVDYGEHEGKALRDVPADIWSEWRQNPAFAPAGGESLAQVNERVAAVCQELFAESGKRARGESDIVVVSHVSPIKAAVAWALGAQGDDAASLAWRLHLSTGSVSRVAYANGVPVLETFNSVPI
jgi:broad specificity phosphatase PhoE